MDPYPEQFLRVLDEKSDAVIQLVNILLQIISVHLEIELDKEIKQEIYGQTMHRATRLQESLKGVESLKAMRTWGHETYSFWPNDVWGEHEGQIGG